MASAFVQLPWLTGSDQFLKAMLAGGEAGIARENIAQRASESAGQIGLGYARLGADERQTAARLAQAGAEQSAQEQYRQELLKDADQRIALSGERAAASQSPYQWMNLGDGEIVMGDKGTGLVTSVRPPRAPQATVTEPQFASEKDRRMATSMGGGHTTLRGTPGAIKKYHEDHPAAAQPAEIRSFDSEEAARAAKVQPGDVIYLRGVGKVRWK